MDAFVRRLVQRLVDPARPLTRNRHFHTLETPEGKRALKISRRLRGLQREILESFARGRRSTYRRKGAEDELCFELTLEHIKGRHISLLHADEFQLLRELPGVEGAIVEAPPIAV
jgi:hypothetical protein